MLYFYIKGCSAGTFMEDDACVDCPVGQYQDQENQTSCIDCPVGSYQDFTGQANCISCAEGYMTSHTGASSSDECYFDFCKYKVISYCVL